MESHDNRKSILQIICNKPTLAEKCTLIWRSITLPPCLCCAILTCNIPCRVSNRNFGEWWSICCLCNCNKYCNKNNNNEDLNNNEYQNNNIEDLNNNEQQNNNETLINN